MLMMYVEWGVKPKFVARYLKRFVLFPDFEHFLKTLRGTLRSPPFFE
jgi:hypothetical protein